MSADVAAGPDAGTPGSVPHPGTGPVPVPSGGTGLQTEFWFELPVGFEDDHGRVHRQGTMRLARARDEITPLRDPRVRDNEAYLTVLLLARTVTRLGDLPAVTTGVIEGLFTPDLAFLQDLYRQVNAEGTTSTAVTCPACREEFAVDLHGGRSGGAPGEW
ncbi:hypothetical protein [Cellulomonas xiejunii]|uniref:Secreted protein n=1 Tax=Cellulomonas xiejunii TaxID=2968083 RepID=A0ABY5KRQ1_9CELL|nr:hypothetical protein [Cellulomonas xiejunii]MCC2320730.1 hypothetical protein [Cellulomonas xiejunii]UUI71018.1 hypothetical protein NP048_14630 [Cellulomonas xiejunii]